MLYQKSWNRSYLLPKRYDAFSLRMVCYSNLLTSLSPIYSDVSVMTNPNEKELNEVDWDKVWYGEFMTRLAHSDYAPCADIDGVLEIVAEAERRTWESAKALVEEFTPGHITREYRDTDSMRDGICNEIDTKLSSLTKK